MNWAEMPVVRAVVEDGEEQELRKVVTSEGLGTGQRCHLRLLPAILRPINNLCLELFSLTFHSIYLPLLSVLVFLQHNNPFAIYLHLTFPYGAASTDH
jgi:hypothetical protein